MTHWLFCTFIFTLFFVFCVFFFSQRSSSLFLNLLWHDELYYSCGLEFPTRKQIPAQSVCLKLSLSCTFQGVSHKEMKNKSKELLHKREQMCFLFCVKTRQVVTYQTLLEMLTNLFLSVECFSKYLEKCHNCP